MVPWQSGGLGLTNATPLDPQLPSCDAQRCKPALQNVSLPCTCCKSEKNLLSFQKMVVFSVIGVFYKVQIMLKNDNCYLFRGFKKKKKKSCARQPLRVTIYVLNDVIFFLIEAFL